jgi:diaminopimelate decarboxylase
MDISELFPVSTSFTPAEDILIGGLSLNKLAEDFGTPLYIYDAATIRQNYAWLKDLFKEYYSGKSQIAFASKAYLSLSFAQKLAQTGAAIDVVSLSELEIVLKAGFEPGKIHLHGNNKSDAEIRLAVASGIESIVIDSLDEFHFVEAICSELRRVPNIWLRINPDIAVNTHKAVQTGHGASKFGIPSKTGEAKKVIRLALDSKSVRLTGIHTHLGSQIFDAGEYGEAMTAMLNLCQSAGFHPQVISPGGGWGVPYTETDRHNDPEAWIREISRATTEWCAKENQPLPEIVIEPGRYLVAQAGVSVYRIGATKQVQEGEWIAAIDGGMADNPRVALYGANYSARFIGNSDERPVVNTRLAGRFCESGDELIHAIPLPQLQRGDLVAIPVSGAYQLSMASNYNLADRPCVLWLENEVAEVLQYREHAASSDWWKGKRS